MENHLPSIKEELCIAIKGKHDLNLFKHFINYKSEVYYYSSCKVCGFGLVLEQHYLHEYKQQYYGY